MLILEPRRPARRPVCGPSARRGRSRARDRAATGRSTPPRHSDRRTAARRRRRHSIPPYGIAAARPDEHQSRRAATSASFRGRRRHLEDSNNRGERRVRCRGFFHRNARRSGGDRWRERHRSRDAARKLDRSQLDLEMLPAVNAGTVELLDDPKLLREPRGLERRRGAAGRDRVDHRAGEHDDRANSVAGVVALIASLRRSEEGHVFAPPIVVNAYDPEQPWLGGHYSSD